MAIIKCKMCGGNLELVEGTSVCECEYCGTRQTVPNADNEKKMTLFTRASRLLRNCEFDKAAGVFETIVADFPEEAEAYWGLVLCKYGIEYVDDPATGKKVPTCHRSSFESVEDDTNFEQACENADAVARRLYREEARQIETLRKRILEVSGKEEPYDIFISYKELDENGERTVDSVIAQDIYKALEKEGYRVFFSRISLEGKLGIEYEPYIFAALNSAKVMIVVGTDYDNFDAVWVKNEWNRFLKLISNGQQKTIIPVYKDMDPYDMPKELRNLAAQNMGKIGAMQDLLHGVGKLIPLKGAESEELKLQDYSISQVSGPNVIAFIKRGQQALEDKEWEKADHFFDQALNIDAECADAFLGKYCASEKAENLEAIFYQRFLTAESQEKSETIHIPKDYERIEQIASQYQVAGYLTVEAIQAELETQSVQSQYNSRAEYWRTIVQKEFERIKNNKLLFRARQFARGETKAQIENVLEQYEEKLSEAVARSAAEEKAAEQRSKEQYIDCLKKKEATIAEKSKVAHEKRDQDYRSIIVAMAKAETSAEWLAIQDKLVVIGAYKEAPSFLENCLAQIDMLAYKEKKIMETTQTEIKAIQDQYQETENAYEDECLRVEELQKKAEKALDIMNKAESALKPYQTEYDGLHGVFSGRRRKELEEKIRRQNLVVIDVKQTAENLQSAYEKALSELPQKPDERELRYNIAGKYYDNGFLAEAAREYFSIRSYKDVSEIISNDQKLSTIINNILIQNREQYETVGNTVKFGHLRQTVDNSEKQPIEWNVLEYNNNRSLLISRYALDSKAFDDQQTNIWGNSSIRSWLNNRFLDEAFNQLEKKALVKTKIDCGSFYVNDSVFLLSTEEARYFYKSDIERLCEPTPFAKANKELYMDESNKYCCWWLRTRSTGHHTNDWAMHVHYDGYIGSGGDAKNWHHFDGSRVGIDKVGVRPAIWIDLKSEFFQ